MPEACPSLLGLSFHIYFKDHPPPHVHVKYGDYEALINIKTG